MLSSLLCLISRTNRASAVANPATSRRPWPAAALQYVRKISGFRAPAGHNAEAFGHAVDAVAAATATLLGQLEVRTPQRQ